jgi:hypothetical protein
MTAVDNTRVNCIFALAGGSWLIQSMNYRRNLYSFFIVHSDGTKEEIHKQNDSRIEPAIFIDRKRKQFIIAEYVYVRGLLRKQIVWQEVGGAKQKNLIEEVYYEEIKNNKRNGIICNACIRLKDSLALGRYDFENDNILSYFDPRIIKAIKTVEKSSRKDLLFVDLSTAESKIFTCPFPVRDAHFNLDGTALLVRGNGKFCIIDNPMY